VSSLVLFDTHVVIWSIAGDRRLGPETRSLLRSTINAGIAAISVASVYELAWVVLQQRAAIDQTYPDALEGLSKAGVRTVDINDATARTAAALDLGHGDPIDRFIAATALQTDGLLVTADRKLLEARLPLKTHDARL
jgi:PIN domain nuclease of toxin-antitoxin system